MHIKTSHLSKERQPPQVVEKIVEKTVIDPEVARLLDVVLARLVKLEAKEFPSIPPFPAFPEIPKPAPGKDDEILACIARLETRIARLEVQRPQSSYSFTISRDPSGHIASVTATPKATLNG